MMISEMRLKSYITYNDVTYRINEWQIYDDSFMIIKIDRNTTFHCDIFKSRYAFQSYVFKNNNIRCDVALNDRQLLNLYTSGCDGFVKFNIKDKLKSLDYKWWHGIIPKSFLYSDLNFNFMRVMLNNNIIEIVSDTTMG